MKDNIMILLLLGCLYYLITGSGGFNTITNIITLDKTNKKQAKQIKKNRDQIAYIKRELNL